MSAKRKPHDWGAEFLSFAGCSQRLSRVYAFRVLDKAPQAETVCLTAKSPIRLER